MIVRYLFICLSLFSITAAAQQSITAAKLGTGRAATGGSDHQQSENAVAAFVRQLNDSLQDGMKINENLVWTKKEYLVDNKRSYLRVYCKTKDGKLVTTGVLPGLIWNGSHYEISLYRNFGDVFERHIDFISKGKAYSYPLEVKNGKFVMHPEMDGGKGHDYNVIISGGLGN